MEAEEHRHAGRDAEEAARAGEHQRQHEADVGPGPGNRAAHRRLAALLGGTCQGRDRV